MNYMGEKGLFAGLSDILRRRDADNIHARASVIAAVGGGGKTGLLFALAKGFAQEGARVILTTTTHILDPQKETGRSFDRVIVEPFFSGPAFSNNAALLMQDALRACSPHKGEIVIVASGLRTDIGQLHGVHSDIIPLLRHQSDIVLIEADGSRGLPVKAPAAHEPVIPSCADIVFGMIGLDCVGKPMNGSIVHRPEIFGPLAQCAALMPIHATHLARLAESPQGLFKNTPQGAQRIVMLNKADILEKTAREIIRDTWSQKPPSGIVAAYMCSVKFDRVLRIFHRQDGQG